MFEVKTNYKISMFFGFFGCIMGILMFCFYDYLVKFTEGYSHPVVLEWMVDYLGRYGMFALIFGSGVLAFVRARKARKEEEEQKQKEKSNVTNPDSF